VSVVESPAGTEVEGALRALLRRGGALPLATGARPPGDGWLRLSDLTDDADLLRGWVRSAGERHGGPDVAASYLVIWLAWPLARLLVAPALQSGRAVVADATTLWIRRHPRGWVMGTAAEAPTLAVAPTDPLAAQAGPSLPGARRTASVADQAVGLAESAPGVVVALDVAALRAEAVRRLVDALAPVVAGLRGLSRRGPHSLWGGVVDAVARVAVDALGPGASRDQAGAAVEQLLAAADPPLRARPQVLAVPHEGRLATALSFSVCCFGDKDPSRGFAVCAGCPKRTPGDMVEQLATCLPRSA
jgi:hypothetical protein